MKDKQENNILVTLRPDGVFAPLLTTIGQIANNVLFGLQLIDSVDKLIDPNEIKTENTFFTLRFNDISQQPDIGLSKDKFKLWILQKGFEDLIKGVNLTLIEAYYFVSIIAKQDNLKTLQDLQKEYNDLRETALKQFLPGLLTRVKPGLIDNLTYEGQINSINKVRNCLVHRDGFVTDKDINDQANDQLTVEYVRMKIYIEKDNEEIEVEKNKAVGEAIKMRNVNASLSFKRGDRIKFDYQQFNHLLTTCYLFGLDLVQKLPKGNSR